MLRINILYQFCQERKQFVENLFQFRLSNDIREFKNRRWKENEDLGKLHKPREIRIDSISLIYVSILINSLDKENVVDLELY